MEFIISTIIRVVTLSGSVYTLTTVSGDEVGTLVRESDHEVRGLEGRTDSGLACAGWVFENDRGSVRFLMEGMSDIITSPAVEVTAEVVQRQRNVIPIPGEVAQVPTLPEYPEYEAVRGAILDAFRAR